MIRATLLSLLLCFICFYAQGVEGRQCKDKDDCEDGECCLSFGKDRYKLNKYLRLISRGRCKKGGEHCFEKTTPCNNPHDCKPGHCCVSNIRPVGAHSMTKYRKPRGRGHCKPMGGTGSACLTKNKIETRVPELVYLMCPCDPGLTCVHDGTFDIPLGPKGKCRKLTNKKKD